jgi:lipopolysaccharide/colanic/teichoic acid biosynthesis glycosyltransferase
MIKRAFDVVVAGCGLIVLAPLLLLVAVAIRLDSPGPVLFRQSRIGCRFRPFLILKFRTMGVASGGSEITVAGDTRITRVGRLLRKTKLDEVPQLVNVLRGDMSIVGPRPEVPRYVALFRREFEEVLSVRPGITDPASLKYRDEGVLLQRAANPEDAYVRRILPDKLQISAAYVASASFLADLVVIGRTLVGLLVRNRQVG